MDKKLYKKIFIDVLEKGIYNSGHSKDMDLVFLYDDIIKSLKTTSYIKDNIQHTVTLTEIDLPFLEDRLSEKLEKTKRQISNYSKGDIFDVICNSLSEINENIKSETIVVENFNNVFDKNIGFSNVSISDLRNNKLI